MTRFAVSADGTRIAYDVHGATAGAAGTAGTAGDGGAGTGQPPILLVHGFASDPRVTWEATGWVRFLQRAGREVITVDLRGHGRSDSPVDAARYAPDVQAADLRAVLDGARVSIADVVAYSMGARIASALARLAPSSIRRLVLGGTGPLEVFATWRGGDDERMLRTADFDGNPIARAVVGPALAAGADPAVLLACIRGMTGAPLLRPGEIPVLIVVGELDPVGAGAAELAVEWRAAFASIPGRDHINVLTARVFKDAALVFLG
ncbi:alpha/beta fold hydrolase [Leifsonia sp. YIM 134122]|uniref:Alpha/beta fold hydrolase n=1 Tax=Leifsonia stereocauli TaxID=3134136 RepID=A0ABU9W6M6_9MICO